MTPATFKCQHCGGDTYVEPPEGPAICAECCGKRGEHEWYYERAERQRLCTHCNELGPDEYEPMEGDVSISFRDTAGTRGTPISQLSGRPGHDGFAEFCRIAATWGYD